MEKIKRSTHFVIKYLGLTTQYKRVLMYLFVYGCRRWDHFI